MLSIKEILIAIFAIGAIVFLERAFPFILFSKRKPPKLLRFIERYIPPLILTILLVYCLKSNFDLADLSAIVPAIIGLAITTITYLYRKNVMISISLGTIIYMIMI
ncbi:MAG: AzlD domain-containing protein [Elusimicrobiota bacterium]|nr:AzlD domain-containing protein [Elusimicrobiota bacterium]